MHVYLYMPYTILYICHIHMHIHIHTHMWHICINIYDIHPTTYVTCMCIHTSSETQLHFQTDIGLGRKLGFWAWYTCTCTAYIQIQRWHMYTSEIWCPFRLISYMCMYKCYLHTLTYVTYINIHMWKIHICMHMSYICGMYTCIIAHGICICIYVHMWPTCIYTCVTYIHITYVTYIHILHTYPTYIHMLTICETCDPYAYIEIWIWHIYTMSICHTFIWMCIFGTYVHIYICYLCTYAYVI